MNTRLLGILCIAGTVIALVAALGQVALDDSAGTLGDLVLLVWGLGAIAGLVGLIQGNAVGSNPMVRAVAFLPIIALVLNILALIAKIAGTGTSDNILFIVGYFGTLAGLVLVSILTIAAKTWQGWRRFVPLLVLVMFIAGIGVGSAGSSALGNAVLFAPWALLGQAVATGEPVPAAPRSATAL